MRNGHVPRRTFCTLVLLSTGLLGSERIESDTLVDNPTKTKVASAYGGSNAGDEHEVAGVKLCWCPSGGFTMGSPRGEPERRPGEDQVTVTLSRGFWMGKYEVTQGQWRQFVGAFPGKYTAGEGDDFPVYDINFAAAEGFCRKLTEKARARGDLPTDWEFRLPTEAQWEYACRAGTTTATSFGDKLSSKQANFQGKPYNGAEEGPSLKHESIQQPGRPAFVGLVDSLDDGFPIIGQLPHLSGFVRLLHMIEMLGETSKVVPTVCGSEVVRDFLETVLLMPRQAGDVAEVAAAEDRGYASSVQGLQRGRQ